MECIYEKFLTNIKDNIEYIIRTNIMFNSHNKYFSVDAQIKEIDKCKIKKFIKIIIKYIKNIYLQEKIINIDKFIIYKISNNYSYNSIEYYVKNIIELLKNEKTFNQQTFDEYCQEFYVCIVRHILFISNSNIMINVFYNNINNIVNNLKNNNIVYNTNDNFSLIINKNVISINDFNNVISNSPKNNINEFKNDIYKIIDICMKFKITKDNYLSIFNELTKDKIIKIYLNIYQNNNSNIGNLVCDIMNDINAYDFIMHLTYNYQMYLFYKYKE
jgi:hypothetical protein